MLYAFGLTEKYETLIADAAAKRRLAAKGAQGMVFETEDQARAFIETTGRDPSTHTVFGVVTDLSNTFVDDDGRRRLLTDAYLCRLSPSLDI